MLQLGEDSDYDKLNDMVKYLDLELHFGTQKNPSEYNVPTCVSERGCLCVYMHNAYVSVHTVCLHILYVLSTKPCTYHHQSVLA